MAEFKRQFTHQLATPADVPLLIGLTGASSSGKTWSALELAKGIQSVRGGDIYLIDTEGGRARHYSPWFNFQHVPFSPPFSPLDYKAAIDHCVSSGAKIIIVDSMSHEHDGDGGVLEQIEDYLDRKAGDNWDARESYKWAAQIRPKAQRKELNHRILQLTDVTFVFCYRAHERIRIAKKGEKGPDGKTKSPEKGWAPISTSPLFFDMTLRLLLPPGSDGRPLFFPQDEGEKLLTKLPYQFREWFKAGDQLNAEIGRKLALWAKGGDASGSPALLPPPAPASPPARAATWAKGSCTILVKNVADGPKAPWSIVSGDDSAAYWTKDKTFSERARMACEMDAKLAITYAEKPGASPGETIRVIDTMDIVKEE